MDSLVEIPRSEWAKLRDLYKNDWPKRATAFCMLDSYITYPELNDKFDFKVYCPEGKIINGMVATANMSNYYQIFIHPLYGIAKIKDALLKTNIISWDRSFEIPFASDDVIDCLKRIRGDLKLNIKYENFQAIKYMLNANSSLYTISCPTNTYVRLLKPEHIYLVDKTWTFHSAISHNMFEALRNVDLIYALYSFDDHTPLAWISINERGALTHLYCVDSHRKKGYAEFITKYAANQLLSNGKSVLAFTMDTNVKSKNLLNKLGFELLGHDHWALVNKV